MKGIAFLTGSPWEAVLWTLTIVLLAANLLITYRQWHYWNRRLRKWQHRLRARVDTLNVLIEDGQRAQDSYVTNPNAAAEHTKLVERYDSQLSELLGDAVAKRIADHRGNEWTRPAGLISDDQVFAWYDTERRLAGLKELLHEVEWELASLDE